MSTFRLAIRRLARNPAFTAGTIAILALGSGAALAAFTVFNALLLKPLPVHDPGSLVTIAVEDARGEPSTMSAAAFSELALRQSSFESIAASLGSASVSASVGTAVHQVVATGVTAEFFRVVGIVAGSGRVLNPTDFRSAGLDADAVCVLSDAYWRRALESSSDAIGRTLTLGEATFTVVGVAAAPFSGVEVGVAVDVFVPAPLVGGILGLPANVVPMGHVVARIAPERSMVAIKAELSSLWPGVLATTAPQSAVPGRGAIGEQSRLVARQGATGVSYWRSRYEDPLRLVLFSSIWLGVIGCANLAGIQLAHGRRRSREIAVRQALGASRWQVMRPAVIETLLLCASGLTVGAVLAQWIARVATDLMSAGATPLRLDLSADWRLLCMMTAALVLATLVAGLAPAWLASRPPFIDSHRSRLVPGDRRAGALVVGQVALAVVLLTGAVLAMSTMLGLWSRDPGFSRDDVVVAQLMNQPGGYATLNDAVYYRTLLDRLRSLPGVTGAALAKPVPATSGGQVERVVAPVDRDGFATARASTAVVSPGFFAALGVPILTGRDVSWADTLQSPPIALVSRSLASRLYPSGSAIGKHVRVGSDSRAETVEIVGIAEDASVIDVRETRPAVVYLSALQQPPPLARWPGLIVRTSGEVPGLAQSIGAAVETLGHEFPTRIQTLALRVDRSLARERLLALLAVVYGLLAVAIVGIGTWALLAYEVARRTREMGVRLAVGASPARLLRGVLGKAFMLTLIGLAIGGMLSALAADHVVGVTGGAAHVWKALAGVACMIGVLGIVAAVGPAWRAASVDPVEILRID